MIYQSRAADINARENTHYIKTMRAAHIEGLAGAVLAGGSTLYAVAPTKIAAVTTSAFAAIGWGLTVPVALAVAAGVYYGVTKVLEKRAARAQGKHMSTEDMIERAIPSPSQPTDPGHSPQLPPRAFNPHGHCKAVLRR